MVGDLHQSNTARDREEDAPEPPQIRRFRRLVSFTMVAMVVGILVILGALVWKLTQSPAPMSGPIFKGEIEVPADFKLIAVSRTQSSLFLILKNSKNGEQRLEERSAGTNQLIGRYTLQKLEH